MFLSLPSVNHFVSLHTVVLCIHCRIKICVQILIDIRVLANNISRLLLSCEHDMFTNWDGITR
jgi:hypothetical protein